MAHDATRHDFSTRTSEYSLRVPDPPRVIVPALTLNEEALPQLSVKPLSTNSYLNIIDYNDIVKRNAAITWSYELRRDAQMILPNLYLGPLSSIRADNVLTNFPTQAAMELSNTPPITLILGVCASNRFHRHVAEVALGKAAVARGVATHVVSVEDGSDQIRSFPVTTRLINEHLIRYHDETGTLGAVLVVCETGNERSAAAVAAFLMEMHEAMDHIKAIQLVQAQRFCVTFGEPLKRALQTYWDLLCAQRQVAASRAGDEGHHGQLDQSVTKARKRSVGSLDAILDGFDLSLNDELSSKSRSFAPFADTPN